MNTREPPALEMDPAFPSGPWTGFFMQRLLPGRHTMDMNLTFGQGRLRGQGADLVGPFTFEGEYDATDGKCRWTKHYLGKHDVTYQGFNQGNGIWGAWEILALGGWYRDHGVFHIWPKGMTPSEEADLTARAMPGFGMPTGIKVALRLFLALCLAAGYILVRYFLDQF